MLGSTQSPYAPFASRLTAGVLIALATATASADFRFVQIEQVLGGVGCNPANQVIQLRMRSAGQSDLAGARLVARDDEGLNPVVIIDFDSAVANGAFGDRVLIASPGMAAATTPAMAADFVMTDTIPMNYLFGGTLTYEDDAGAVLWRVSWGGISYRGPTSGSTLNDSDGDFGPALPGMLPIVGVYRFTGNLSNGSNSNQLDYTLETQPMTFVNNSGRIFTIGGGCAGDLTGDGRTDAADLGVILWGWGHSGGDVTGDGMTDESDLGVILSDWSCTSA